MNTVYTMGASAGGSMVPWIIAGVMGFAVLLFMGCIWLINTDRRSELEKRLTVFGVSEEQEPDDEGLFGPREQQYAETKLTQDLVNMSGRIAERVGLLNSVENKLE